MKFFFRCSICRSVPEIFAIKVESCQKPRQNLEIGPPKFLGRAFQKLYARYQPYLASRRLEKFREDTPPSPEIIEAHTLIFKPNFKFSQLKFFGGTPSQLGCALASLGQSLSHVKVQVAEPPNGRNVVSRKISIWVGQYEPIELFCLWTKVYQSFFAQRGRGCGWSSFSQMFDMSINSGDIRDQSRKLSEIKPKFGRILALGDFGGGPSKSCTRVIIPASRHVVWKNFVRMLTLAPKLLRLIRWILSLILNFHN